ncbi:hypothetical protein [Anaeroselena agilis]|uniref:Uncharacterized protein n=1 Tax=Anaeroselena agilis TaxID=3063788 RepID=A0ABU3P2E5_9FIRM|nr:hypothetical protein [Selenomonadales bacterium 4137-cl]
MYRKLSMPLAVLLASAAFAGCGSQPAATQAPKAMIQKEAARPATAHARPVADQTPIIFEEKDAVSDDYRTVVDFGIREATTYDAQDRPVKSGKRLKVGYVCDYRSFGDVFIITSLMPATATNGRILVADGQTITAAYTRSKTVRAPSGKANVTYVFIDEKQAGKKFADLVATARTISAGIFLDGVVHYVDLGPADLVFVRRAMAQAQMKAQ